MSAMVRRYRIPQELAAADGADELLNRGLVVEVPPRRDVVHREVKRDERAGVGHVVGGEAEPRQDARAELGAAHGVVLPGAGRVGIALSDVVEEGRQE